MSPARAQDHPRSDGVPSSLGTVAILGIGLMGGSLGMALRQRGAVDAVVGWNRSPKALPIALERGAIDYAASSPQEAVTGADVVVIGVPVDATVPLLRQILPALKPSAVVTDVGSVKERLVREAAQVLPERFVGGHPMAGSEEAGVSAASANLYENAAWALTPTANTAPAAVDRIRRMAEIVGAKVYSCDAALHDRLVASVSHLPHILAYGLAQVAGEAVPCEWTGLAAGSFRDGTRVALSSPALWTGILRDNREAALESIDRFTEWLTSVREAIENEKDSSHLADLLERAHAARLRFPR